jgi:hypothetical protein
MALMETLAPRERMEKLDQLGNLDLRGLLDWMEMMEET